MNVLEKIKTDYHHAECHLFRMFDKNILFNVETMLFYEITPLVYEMVTMFSKNNNSDPIQSLEGKYKKDDIINTLIYLGQEGFLKEGTSNVIKKKPILRKRWGIRHLELMVTHGCNLGCRYCYGAGGYDGWKDTPYLYGAKTAGMPFEIAKKGVDFLIENSGKQKDLSIVFFGGEPLLEFALIEKIVPYIREKESGSGKTVNLSLSTNGLLLDEKIVDFLVKHNVGCQVSIDGPREIQDRNRSLRDGGGSYEHVLPGIKRLISARRGRVPARATVSHDLVNLGDVVDHLLSLGFGSVHIEPAIGKSDGTALTAEDVDKIKRQHEALACLLVKNVRRNRFFNYSNLVKYIRHTRVIRERLAYYCGAGRTYFALSQEGDFYPCHRFVGMGEYKMGDLGRGMDMKLQQKILGLTVDNRPVCRDCWARYLCGGGCWKHGVDMHGCLEIPDNDFSCEIIRHEIECAMAINSELQVSDKEILDNTEIE